MKNRITYIMLGVGLLLQVISFIITRDAWLSFVSGLSGVFAVVYCSERKMSYYVWSFIQMITFTIICWQTGLYGKLFENGFNFVTMVIGVYIWMSNKDTEDKVKTRSLGSDGIANCVFGGLLGWVLLYMFLVFVGGSMPLLDSITTTLAFIAQILMIYRYKESWILWAVIDLICVVIWTIEGNWCIVAQYVFWTINAVYGYVIWEKNQSV